MDQLVHNIQQVFPDLSSLQIVEKIKECNFDIDQAVEQMFEEQQNSTELSEYDAPVGEAYLRAAERNGYPFIRSIEEIKDLDDRMSRTNKEFALSRTFDPHFLDAAVPLGYFPMAIPLSPKAYACAIKVHKKRSIIRFGDFHVSKNTRKKANRFEFSINKAFQTVVAMCVEQHGENWLYPPLRRAFTYMNEHPTEFKTKVVSVEVWSEGNVVAGELGYVVGRVYTSLTGARTMDSSGTVQLAALGKLLERSGFAFWDLGMHMDYKKDLGGAEVARADFHAEYRSCSSPLSNAFKCEMLSAREVIDGAPSMEVGRKETSKRKSGKNPKKSEERKQVQAGKTEIEKEEGEQSSSSSSLSDPS